MKTHKQLPLLTELQYQIVEGSLLGDGGLRHIKGKLNQNWSFAKIQSMLSLSGKSKEPYLGWHQEELGVHGKAVILSQVETTFKGEKRKYWRYTFKTWDHPIWTSLGKKWYLHDAGGDLVYDERGRKIKVVPRDLKLTSLSTCIWFMDDGSNGAKEANAVFCTHGFFVDDVDFLVDRLREDLGIRSKRRLTKKGQPIIYVGRKSYFDLMDCISPHMEWDCFAYKVDTSTYKKKSGRGEEHHAAKLTEDKVRRVFALKGNGLQNKQIALELCISKTNVTLILNGDRWGHLGLAKEPRRMGKRMTEEQKVEALKLLQDGLLEKEVAARFKVSQPTINRLKHKK